MSWVKFRLGRGTIRIKPRSQLRSYETEGVVPSVNLGLCVISWWSDAAQQRYDGGHWAYRVANPTDAELFTPPAVTKTTKADVPTDLTPP